MSEQEQAEQTAAGLKEDQRQTNTPEIIKQLTRLRDVKARAEEDLAACTAQYKIFCDCYGLIIDAANKAIKDHVDQNGR